MRLLALLAFTLCACDCGGGTPECAGPADCPSTHDCVTGAGGKKLCLRREPPDASEEPDPDLDASTPYYCDEVKPILDRTCLDNCHGATHDGSNDGTFRLDMYAQPDGGAGAFARAARVKFRIWDLKNMPPPISSSQPTLEERRRVAIWAKRGAPLCADAGS